MIERYILILFLLFIIVIIITNIISKKTLPIKVTKPSQIQTIQTIISKPTQTISLHDDNSIINDYDDNNSSLNSYNYLCKNCVYVNQSQMKISENLLYTNKVGSCSVLIFNHDNKNFMAHIDSMQNNSKELDKFIRHNFNNITNINAVIIPGPWCDNCTSIQIIKTSLNNLGIKYTFYDNSIKFEDTINFNKNISITN